MVCIGHGCELVGKVNGSHFGGITLLACHVTHPLPIVFLHCLFAGVEMALILEQSRPGVYHCVNNWSPSGWGGVVKHHTDLPFDLPFDHHFCE